MKDEPLIRRSGYYWVKVHKESEWITSFYNEETKLWMTLSASLRPMAIGDDGWFGINETRILNPGSVSV